MLAADALMNLQPWDYWADGGSAAKGRTADALALLEDALDRNPSHPGLIHFYIHLVEASDRPERAEPYADRLAELMPGAGAHRPHAGAHLPADRPVSGVGRDQTSTPSPPTRPSFAALGRRDGGIYGQGLLPPQPALRPGVGADGGRRRDERSTRRRNWRGWCRVEAAGEAAWFAADPAGPVARPRAVRGPGDAAGATPRGPAERGPTRSSRPPRHYARAVRGRSGAGDTATGRGRTGGRGPRSGPGPRIFLGARRRRRPGGRCAGHRARGDRRPARPSRRGDAEQAVEAFRRGAALQDGLPYMEPPYLGRPGQPGAGRRPDARRPTRRGDGGVPGRPRPPPEQRLGALGSRRSSRSSGRSDRR